MNMLTKEEKRKMGPGGFNWKFFLGWALISIIIYLWITGNVSQNLNVEHRKLVIALESQVENLEEKVKDRKELAGEFNIVWLDGFDTGYEAAIEELDCMKRINVTTIGGVE